MFVTMLLQTWITKQEKWTFGNYGFRGGDNYNFGYISRPGENYQDFIFQNDDESHLFKIEQTFI